MELHCSLSSARRANYAAIIIMLSPPNVACCIIPGFMPNTHKHRDTTIKSAETQRHAFVCRLLRNGVTHELCPPLVTMPSALYGLHHSSTHPFINYPSFSIIDGEELARKHYCKRSGDPLLIVRIARQTVLVVSNRIVSYCIVDVTNASSP